MTVGRTPASRQIPKHAALYELLTGPVMHGAIITFDCGLTYTVGKGWDVPREEAYARLRDHWHGLNAGNRWSWRGNTRSHGNAGHGGSPS